MVNTLYLYLALKRLRTLWWLLLLLPGVSSAALIASVDRNRISEEDIISLTIRSTDGQVADLVNLSALKQDFSILNQKQSNKISFINGQRSSVHDFILVVAPNRSGELTIPSFSVKGEKTEPIKITVSAGPADPKQALSEVFLENRVSKQEVYVQEQFGYQLKIHHSTGLDSPRLSPPEIENAVVKQVGEQKNYERIIQGMRYSVVEINYSVTPESSGKLVIPEQVLTARTVPVARNIFRSNGRHLRIKSATQIVNVLPKPASYPIDRPWLPTPELTVDDSWDEISPELHAGDPTTRTITLSAIGLSAAQLPDLPLPSVAGVKIYPDQPSLEDREIPEGNLGIRSVAAAIVPNQEGFIELPGFDLIWWNTRKNRLEKTVVPARKLPVKPATQQALHSQPPTTPFTRDTGVLEDRELEEPSSGATFWPFLTLTFAILWLTTLGLFIRTRRKPTKISASSGQSYEARIENRYSALKALKRATAAHDYSQIRQSLISWFNAVYPDHKIENLDDIRHLAAHDELNEQIMALQAQLYGDPAQNMAFSGEKLLSILEQIRRAAKKQSFAGKPTPLKPLYPL